jgi:DNA repair exonuclease SbcCD ATPase subunit
LSACEDLKVIPSGIGRVKGIKLTLPQDSSKIEFPPPEICKEGCEAVLKYLRSNPSPSARKPETVRLAPQIIPPPPTEIKAVDTETLKKRIRELEEELSSTQKEKQQARDDLKRCQEEKQSLEQQLKENENELFQAEIRAKVSEQRVKDLEDDLKRCHGEKQSLEQQLKENEKEMMLLRRQLEALTKEREGDKKKVAQMEAEMKQKEEAEEKMKQEIERDILCC